MVDEAHERSLATDTLLGLLKKVQKRRPELRLIISSATLEVDRLVEFFDGSTSRRAAPAAGVPSKRPAVLGITGRVYPVQVRVTWVDWMSKQWLWLLLRQGVGAHLAVTWPSKGLLSGAACGAGGAAFRQDSLKVGRKRG
jgi:HrpA-like RNA helicase